jgi:putative hemolysin
MKSKWIVLGFLCCMLLMAGCGSPVNGATKTAETPTVLPVTDTESPTDAQAGSVIGMANPASVYCEEQGGTLDMRDSDAGQYGVCVFPDGNECEEWAFFRGECRPGAGANPTEAVIGMANPASVYCEERGGTVEMRTSDAGQYGVCVFPDSSECEEWAFFRGECGPGTPAPKLVFGWYGRVITPPADQPFENYLMLSPKEAGNAGLMTSDPAVKAQLDALRDTDQLAHFWGALICENAGFNKETEFGGCVLDVTRLRVDGPGDFFAPDPVEGWAGVLVSLSSEPGSGGDDAFILDDPVFKVQYGLHTFDPAVAAQLNNLRDRHVRFYVWGELTCGIPDTGGCQIVVTRIESGKDAALRPEVETPVEAETITEPVEDWVGVVVSNPEGAQFDDYFQMLDQNDTRAGITGSDAIGEQLVALRDTGTMIHVWGVIRRDVPDAYGAQIEVTRIEIDK